MRPNHLKNKSEDKNVYQSVAAATAQGIWTIAREEGRDYRLFRGFFLTF